MALRLSHLDGTNGFRLDGIAAGDQSGGEVAAAGDVNGDGVGDLIIGARLADADGKASAGESYVVFGSTAGFAASLDLSALNGSNGFRIGGDASPSVQASARPGLVIVPNTIGMTFQEGIDAATAAGLDWTVACSTQPDRPEQIFDQEPPAGTEVAPGSPFTMFFPRFEGFCSGG